MTTEELREEISIELELIENTVKEAISILLDLSETDEPTVREKTAAAAFLAQILWGS